MNLELSWKEGGGGLKEELFSTLRYCLEEKKVERGRGQDPKKREKDCNERCHVCVRVKTFSPSPWFLPWKVGMKRGLSASHR